MEKIFYRNEPQEQSLLSERVIISQAPTNYEIHHGTIAHENLKACLNSRDAEIRKFERKDPSYYNNRICEGLSCNNLVALEVEADAGKFGIIELYLCEHCANKFLIE